MKEHLSLFLAVILVVVNLFSCSLPDGGSPGNTPSPEINVQQGSNNLPSGSGSYDFGSVVADGNDGTASGYATFTIQNLGSADLTVSSVTMSGSDFDKTDPLSTTVAPSSSTTFTIRFDPLTSGSRSATVTITNNDSDEGTYTFTVNGTGTAPGQPEINVRQNLSDLPSGSGSYYFGSINADGDGGAASSYVTFTIQNLGSADLTVSSVTMSGSDFDKTDPLSTTVAPSSSTTFTIRFDPLAAGSRSATVTITNNDSDEGTYTFTVSGTGIGVPEINVQQGSVDLPSGSGTYDFGSTAADGNNGVASAYVTFTIQNLGTGNLTISSATVSGSDFDITSPGVLVAPSGSTTFTIRFDPLAVGGCSAMVTISNSDSNEGTYTFTVTGTGIAGQPEINVQDVSGNNLLSGSGSYDFGAVYADGDLGETSMNEPFYIKNLGTGSLTISSAMVSGSDFDIVGTVPTTVAPSGQAMLALRFDPLAVGSRSATVTITNNDSDEGTYTFTVTGTGGIPHINVRQDTTPLPDGATYDFGIVQVGSSSEVKTFIIENLGTAPLNLYSEQTMILTPAQFVITPPATGYIAPGASVTFTAKFAPTQAGMHGSCYITLGSNDPDESSIGIGFTGAAF
jgi:hypothetical protein